MERSLYLIRNVTDGGNLYYAEHGEMGGVTDAVGYDIPPHAMKFRTHEEAQNYITTKLPKWARDRHKVAELDASDFTWLYWGFTSMIHAYEPIPDRLMQATPGHLRTWRHKGGKSYEPNFEKQNDCPDGRGPGAGGRAG